ncbi:peroxin-16 [Cryptococcus neoformans AD2-60a]|nr:peroxin-16 [Cryptococcus neoformans var. grubii AD2-60a]OXG32135.1 peroxin-16 [Cryptococcus neoformans var. grubii Bt15]OXG39658.1 peroxin-16 [Cryptococcus neoformans var. grubii Bt120]
MSPLEAYHSFLLSNLSAVQTIESSISNITWLLPGRFEDAEVASEGLYALLSLVAGYHDKILSSHLSSSLSLPPHPFAKPRTSTEPLSASQESVTTRIHPLLQPPSDHARYTRYWIGSSSLYEKASRALSTISYLELLVEMVARKKLGDRRRWKVALGLESLKTFLRLLLMLKTRRPVLSQPTPQREFDLASLPPGLLDPSSSQPQDGNNPVTPQLPAYSPLRSHLFPMAGNLPEKYLEHPLDLIPQLKGSEYIAEVVACCVGLVRVYLLIRASRQGVTRPYNPSSLPTLSRLMSPYLIPLVLLLLSRRLRSKGESPLLMSHYAQQDKKLALQAFMTGPMWIGWTRPKIVSVARTLERIPILGLVGDLVEGYLPLVDDYFFYTTS